MSYCLEEDITLLQSKSQAFNFGNYFGGMNAFVSVQNGIGE